MSKQIESLIPMLTIRFDDGYLDCVTDYKPILDSFDVIGVSCILVAMIGMFGYMTWEQVKALYLSKWEILSHGLTDIDISFLSSIEAESHILGSKNILINNGFKCNNFVPHQGAIFSEHIRDLAGKYYRSVHCGGNVPVKGLNPKILDSMNMFAICADTKGEYSSDTETGIHNVKELLKIASEENRWLIYYFHKYNKESGDNLKKVIEYALLNNVKIVTINQGLDNCKLR